MPALHPLPGEDSQSLLLCERHPLCLPVRVDPPGPPDHQLRPRPPGVQAEELRAGAQPGRGSGQTEVSGGERGSQGWPLTCCETEVINWTLLQQPAVFGIKVFDTDESTQVGESPTRKVHRKYGQNPSDDGGQEGEEEEYYGTPIFSEESKATGGLESEQPVMTVLREMLNNKSAGISVKDLVNISQAFHHHSESQFGGDSGQPESPQRPGQFENHNEVGGGGDSRGDSDYVEPSPPPPPASEETGGELPEYSDQADQEKTKQIWPYRTDDQYSLFYFQPPAGDETEGHEAEYQWPSLSEYENEYQFQPREPTRQENLNQQIAAHTTAG